MVLFFIVIYYPRILGYDLVTW